MEGAVSQTIGALSLIKSIEVSEPTDHHALNSLTEERTEMKQITCHQAIGAGDYCRHENGTILFGQGDGAGHFRISLWNQFHLRKAFFQCYPLVRLFQISSGLLHDIMGSDHEITALRRFLPKSLERGAAICGGKEDVRIQKNYPGFLLRHGLVSAGESHSASGSSPILRTSATAQA
jgi:hypothetical protein